MSYQESDKLVCVDDKGFDTFVGFTALPAVGTVYVCRGSQGTNSLCHHCKKVNVGIYLVGITGETAADGLEWGFCPNRFRKLDDLKREAAVAKSVQARGLAALAELGIIRQFREIKPDAPWKGKTP